MLSKITPVVLCFLALEVSSAPAELNSTVVPTTTFYNVTAEPTYLPACPMIIEIIGPFTNDTGYWNSTGFTNSTSETNSTIIEIIGPFTNDTGTWNSTGGPATSSYSAALPSATPEFITTTFINGTQTLPCVIGPTGVFLNSSEPVTSPITTSATATPFANGTAF